MKKFTYRSVNPDLLQRIVFKITSGRFLWTCVVAGVFAYLACTGMLPIDRVMEVILVCLYAYFTQRRPPSQVEIKEEDQDALEEK